MTYSSETNIKGMQLQEWGMWNVWPGWQGLGVKSTYFVYEVLIFVRWCDMQSNFFFFFCCNSYFVTLVNGVDG